MIHTTVYRSSVTRQVTVKAHPYDDLRRRRRRLLPNGWRQVAALPDRRPPRPTRTTPGHHRRLRTRGDGPSAPACKAGHRLRGWVPCLPFTPFQWFAEHGGRFRPQDTPLLRTDAHRSRGAACAGTTPRPPLIEGLEVAGDRRAGRVIEHVWRAGRHVPGGGLRPALGWLDCAGPTAPRCRLVRAPPSPRGRGPALGPPSPRACTRTSCGRTGRDARGPACLTAAGTPATTAGLHRPGGVPRRRLGRAAAGGGSQAPARPRQRSRRWSPLGRLHRWRRRPGSAG